MIPEKIFYLFVCLVGVLFAIGFKYFGKSTIDQQKKFNKLVPTHSERDFGKGAVVATQIAFLVGGIFIFIIGLAKLFSSN